MGYAKSNRIREESTAEYFPGRNQRSGSGSQRDEMTTERMVFPIEVNAVEGLLHGIFFEGLTEILRNFVRPIQADLFSE